MKRWLLGFARSLALTLFKQAVADGVRKARQEIEDTGWSAAEKQAARSAVESAATAMRAKIPSLLPAVAALALGLSLAVAPMPAGAEPGDPPPQTTVANLPSCTASKQGTTRVVIDEDDGSAPVSGGGSQYATVECDGGSWSIGGGGTSTTFEEEDGAPTGTPGTYKLPNGTLTDNGDGSFSFDVTPAETDPVYNAEPASGITDSGRGQVVTAVEAQKWAEREVFPWVTMTSLTADGSTVECIEWQENLGSTIGTGLTSCSTNLGTELSLARPYLLTGYAMHTGDLGVSERFDGSEGCEFALRVNGTVQSQTAQTVGVTAALLDAADEQVFVDFSSSPVSVSAGDLVEIQAQNPPGNSDLCDSSGNGVYVRFHVFGRLQ